MSSSFLTQLFDSIDKAKQPESPKDKLLNFEKMIRDDAKSKGYQPRTHLENLCKQSETFANSPLVKMLLGEYDKTKPMPRQLKDPKTEVLVVKNDKVITIDKKDLAKYKADGYELAEVHGGKHTTTGRSMTKGEEKEKERLVKGMKKDKAGFKKRYGKDADAVMYATATKKAMEDGHTDTDSMQAKTAQIAKDAIELYQMFKNNPGDEEIMTWITNKLAVAAEKISSVKDYLQNPTQDEMTEFKKVEIKDKEDYMAKKKELQKLQMDPDTNKNEKLKKEIIKRKADLEDEAKKMGLKEDDYTPFEDANTLKRLKDEVEDFMGQINNMEFGDLNPTRLADELNEILNGTYDPSTDPVNNPEDNDEDYIREQVAMAIELLEKGGIMPAMQMLNRAIGDTHGVEFGKDFPKEDELTLKDDADFHETFGVLAYPTDEIWEAEYRGRKVKLNKPTRGDVKKFKVYVKDPKTGNIKKVNFGHGGTSAKRKTMRIRKSNPARRRSFRARHNCDNPGPKTKARYWSCRNW